MPFTEKNIALNGHVIRIGETRENPSCPDLDALSRAGFQLHNCTSFEDAYRATARFDPFAAIVVADDTSPISLLDTVEGALMARPSLRLICLSSHDAALPTPVENLVRQGLLHELLRLPVDPEHLIVSLQGIRNLVSLEEATEDASPAPENAGEAYMVGSSTAMIETYRRIRKVAPADAPVLITGESGTGKELAARAIHERSPFCKGPFIAINCAGLPASLIGSELFGHEKGAFTGAVARKIGRLEAAQNGTCFLDEIGDFPLELQGHLLRFLQEKMIERLGSTSPISLNVRVIAATNVDLAKAVEKGTFREDLYYRLNVLSLRLPPLRERQGDIELLTRYFIQKFARELRQPVVGLRDSAMTALRNYNWPGNVRELISVIRRAVVMTDRRWLGPKDLSLPNAGHIGPTTPHTLEEARQQAEIDCIRKALESSPANIQAAARTLGVSRGTLYRLIEKHHLREGTAEPHRRATTDPVTPFHKLQDKSRHLP